MPRSASGWGSTRATSKRPVASLVGLDINRRRGSPRPPTAGRSWLAMRPGPRRANPADGITFRELGEHRLKDLRAPERLVQVVGDGPAGRIPAAAVARRPAQQPARPSSPRSSAATRARRGRGACSRDPAADADRARRDREDPTVAPARGDGGGRIPGRLCSCRWNRSATRSWWRRGSRERSASPRAGSRADRTLADHFGSGGAAGPRQLRAGRRRRDRSSRTCSARPGSKAWSRRRPRCRSRASRSTRCRACRRRPIRAACPTSSG